MNSNGLHYSPLKKRIYYYQVGEDGRLKKRKDMTKQVVSTFTKFLSEGNSMKIRVKNVQKNGYKETMILHLNNTNEGIDKAIHYLQTIKKKQNV